MRKSWLIIVCVVFISLLGACQQEVEHTAPAIHDRDSVPVMTSYGVNALIFRFGCDQIPDRYGTMGRQSECQAFPLDIQ
jgi:hypothetical protein